MTTDLTTTSAVDLAPAALLMDRIEAQIAISTMRADLEQIETSLTSFRQQALDFREREGWRALGYTSHLEAIQQELSSEYSRPHLSRLLSAAEVERDLSLPIGTNTPESHLRPLAHLDRPDERREAWSNAQVLAGDSRLTARHVQQAVDDLRTCTACSQVSQSLTVYEADTLAIFPLGARLCAGCIRDLLRDDREHEPAPVEAAHDCACGQRATSKLTIAGLREWRCDACARQARDDEQQQLDEVSSDLRALCDTAESLGATIDYTAYKDSRYVQVVPPATYQQAPLKCDVDDLRTLVERWSQAAPAASVSPAQREQRERAHLLRLWKAIEAALDGGYRAVALKDARELVSILERGVA